MQERAFTLLESNRKEKRDQLVGLAKANLAIVRYERSIDPATLYTREADC
jgi:hypothetical protein